MAVPSYSTLQISIHHNNVVYVELARPTKSNCITVEMWPELVEVTPGTASATIDLQALSAGINNQLSSLSRPLTSCTSLITSEW